MAGDCRIGAVSSILLGADGHERLRLAERLTPRWAKKARPRCDMIQSVRAGLHLVELVLQDRQANGAHGGHCQQAAAAGRDRAGNTQRWADDPVPHTATRQSPPTQIADRQHPRGLTACQGCRGAARNHGPMDSARALCQRQMRQPLDRSGREMRFGLLANCRIQAHSDFGRVRRLGVRRGRQKRVWVLPCRGRPICATAHGAPCGARSGPAGAEHGARCFGEGADQAACANSAAPTANRKRLSAWMQLSASAARGGQTAGR